MPGLLNIYLVRHGQTDSNAGGVLQGHLPTPLNAVGRAQAVRLATRLAAIRPAIEALVTSDLRRAVETAEPIERALALTATREERWRERAFGSFEGKTVGDTEVWRAASGTLDPPGAEAIGALEARVASALEDLALRQAGRQAVAVVTHGGVLRTALHLLATGQLAVADGHDRPDVCVILNASILHLAVDRDRRWRVMRINDVDHLDQDPGPGLVEIVDPNA